MQGAGLKTLLIFIYCAATFAAQQFPFTSPAKDVQFRYLLSELRCMACLHQNLQESDAPLAMDMKQFIYHQVQEGYSDHEIREFLTERYGDVILFKPPIRATTWLLWGAPLIFSGVGFMIFWKMILK